MNIFKLLLSASAICLLGFSLPAAAATDVDIPFDKFTLSNGLTVIVHEDRKAPIVAVSVWYKVGSKDEPVGKTGFAHLFEHLMFNGSENYNDEYFKPFHQVGATAMNGTTWFDRTNYFQNVPTPALDMAMWMESDRMGHLLGAIDQDKLDEQRGVVQNEKRQGDNRPYGKIEYSLLENLFPAGHPYQHSTIGSMADLDAASLEDVKTWFKTYYGAANTVLVLAGDIDTKTAREKAEKYFADIPAGPPVTRITSLVPDRTITTSEVMFERVPQTRILRYWAVPGRTTRENANLTLAAYVIGDGKNSPLYQELVYKTQIASNVTVDLEQHSLASIINVDVMLNPGADEAKANTIIDRVMADFMANGPGKEELARAVTKIRGRTIRGLEQIGGFGGKATALARGELYANDPGFYKTQLNWLSTATTTEVKQTANKWMTDGAYHLTVRPFDKFETVASTVDRSKGLPAVGKLPQVRFPEIQRATLRNGINVVLAERHTVPIVNVALQFDAGYAADSTGAKLGTSSFTMAMLDEGTKNRSALEISEQAETLGANISANSTLDTSVIRLNALKENLKPSLNLMADITLNPTFDQEEIDRLRGRWLANIQQEKIQPVQIALRMLPPLLYGKDHAYGIPFTGSGTEDSIKSLQRDDLSRFHASWIRPDNVTIFIAGDTSMDEILPMLNKEFGKWKANRMAVPKKQLPVVALPEKGRIIIVDKPDAPQSLILAGSLAPSTRADNNLAIGAMNDIIGGNFNARVNMNLREDKHWAYGAYTFMSDAEGQRPYMVYAPVQTDKTAASINELVKELINYIGDKPATPAELDKTIKNNVNSLPGEFETARAVLGSMMTNARFDRPDDYVSTLTDQYSKLNLENIQGAAEQVVHPDKLTWLIVGDRGEIEKQLKEAKIDLGSITIMDADGNVVK